MRKLNAQQKKILSSLNVIDVDAIDSQTWKKIEGINYYETLYADANRFLIDNYSANEHKKLRERYGY